MGLVRVEGRLTLREQACASALAKDPGLEQVEGYVEDPSEGRWTVEHAIDNALPAPAIAKSLFTRFASRKQDSVSNKVVAALRKEFGGHAVRRVDRG